MSAEHDDQDTELVEHQQLNRGAGLQTYESNVPLYKILNNLFSPHNLHELYGFPYVSVELTPPYISPIFIPSFNLYDPISCIDNHADENKGTINLCSGQSHDGSSPF